MEGENMYFFNMNKVYGYGKGPEKPELTISSMSLLEFYLKLLNSFLVSQGEMFVLEVQSWVYVCVWARTHALTHTGEYSEWCHSSPRILSLSC